MINKNFLVQFFFAFGVFAAHSVFAIETIPCNDLVSPPRRQFMKGFGSGVAFAAAAVNGVSIGRAADRPLGQLLYRLDGRGVAFLNPSGAGEIVIYRQGLIQRLQRDGTIRSIRLAGDSDCPSQDAIFVDNYFFSLGQICYLDRNHLVHLMSPPYNDKEDFSMAYLDHDDRFIDTLVNGVSSQGYLKVRRTDRQTQQTHDSTVIEGIPEHSGGMSVDEDAIYISVADGHETHQIFSIDKRFLQKFIALENRAALQFVDVANRVTQPIRGLSLGMIANQQGFVLNNKNFGVYRVDRNGQNKTEMNLPANCELMGLWQGKLLALCANSELRLFE